MTVLDADLIKLIAYVEQRTRARVRDAFYDQNGKLNFVVEEGELGKALGKGAKNLKDLERKLDKKIRIVEYKKNKLDLIRSLTSPLEIVEMEETPEGVVVLKGKDEKTNGLLIGKKARNLRNLEWMVRRFGYEVPEIKVIGP